MQSKKYNIIGYASSLFVDHLFSFMAAILVTSIINFFSNGELVVLHFIICVAIYGGICYGDAHKRGVIDKSKVRLNSISDNKFRGFIAGALAAIPSFIVALLAFLAESGIIFAPDILGQGANAYSVLNRVWHLPLSAFFDALVSGMPLLNFIPPLFIPIVSGIGYILGVNNIFLKQIFVYKNT